MATALEVVRIILEYFGWEGYEIEVRFWKGLTPGQVYGLKLSYSINELFLFLSPPHLTTF